MNVQPPSALLRFAGAADGDPRIDPEFDARPPGPMTLAPAAYRDILARLRA